ncbi:hypothetical protein M0805_008587 [Coniferiporia weirii]|nr:hypothetical protein M0805_008587 [Coniferiporia weirii]
MLPTFLATPFSVLTAVLTNANITDIINVTSSANFTFEPTTLLFVNYPQAEGNYNNNKPHIGILPEVSSENGGSSTANSDSTWWNFATSSSVMGLRDDNDDDGDVWCDDLDDGSINETSGEEEGGYSRLETFQISVNMTVTDIKVTEQPMFALNGTYSADETFLVGIFSLGNTSMNAPFHIHYFGGNFTANSTSNGAISLLTNSTSALLEYCPPKNNDSIDAKRLIYLVFNQNDGFNISLASDFVMMQMENFNISDFMAQTNLDAPIGGTMVWLESCKCPSFSTSNISGAGGMVTWRMEPCQCQNESLTGSSGAIDKMSVPSESFYTPPSAFTITGATPSSTSWYSGNGDGGDGNGDVDDDDLPWCDESDEADADSTNIAALSSTSSSVPSPTNVARRWMRPHRYMRGQSLSFYED